MTSCVLELYFITPTPNPCATPRIGLMKHLSVLVSVMFVVVALITIVLAPI